MSSGRSRRLRAETLTLDAFFQAMAEFGIHPHQDGKCPSPDCRCTELADAVEARAVQIVETKLGHPLPEVAS